MIIKGNADHPEIEDLLLTTPFVVFLENGRVMTKTGVIYKFELQSSTAEVEQKRKYATFTVPIEGNTKKQKILNLQ